VPNDDTVPQTPQQLGLAPGRPARSSAVVASEGALVAAWREKAHPKAEIADRTAVARHPDDALDVGITVRPGRRAVFGQTAVRGTRRMDPAFVAYFAGIEPGEPFDPDDLERAREQLRRLRVFQAARIVEADAITPDGALPIELVVAERKRRALGAGVRFSTIDGLGFGGYWTHRNLFGRAERLTLEGRVAGIEANDPEDYTYRAAATFLKPGVITPFTDLSATLFAEQTRPDTYRARRIGTRVGLVHRLSRRWTVESFGALEASTIDRTRVGDGDFFFASWPTTVRYDGTDNELDPTEGYRVKGTVTPFHEAVNGNTGVISETEVSAYYGLADDRVVLAARAALGSLAGAPLAQVPANRLFFAGGGGSIRGYPYRGVGPVGPRGQVIGGRSYFTGSIEARIGVTRTIGVVPFLDFGNAFRDEFPDFSEPLVFGAGLGVRYDTGLGPLRLDVAVPLDKREGDPEFAFYIGLGQAF
jgi:translocation and assembly module TamA